METMSAIEIKRCKQLDTARDICGRAYDDVGHKSISAVTRKLIKLRDYLNKEFPVKAKGKADKPVRSRRNCDVGTAEAQAKRRRAYCKGRGCRGCPFYVCDTLLCTLRWAQGPYKKGENNGSK